LPKEITAFIRIIQEKEVDLGKLFAERKKAGSFEVPVNLMSSELLRLGFFTPETVNAACDYYSNKSNAVELNAVLECV